MTQPIKTGDTTSSTSGPVPAARAQQLTVVGVSISTQESTRSAEATISALRGVVDGVPILVGGCAVRDGDHARELGADGWACDGRAVVALLEDMAMGSRP